jgi:hypothetical protein
VGWGKCRIYARSESNVRRNLFAVLLYGCGVNFGNSNSSGILRYRNGKSLRKTLKAFQVLERDIEFEKDQIPICVELALHTELLSLEFERLLAEGPTGLRSSVRFPLALPIQVLAAGGQFEAVTDNISAHGVLMHMDELLPAGTEVDFLIEFPPGLISPDQSAAVHCSGKIVRSFRNQSTAYAAAVIYEYSFQ